MTFRMGEGSVHGKQTVNGGENAERYTPQEVVDRLLAFWPDGIDLDPCSPGPRLSPIPARRHYTKADDGLALPWHGRVFANPPYGRGKKVGINPWIEKAIDEYETGRADEIVLLVPNRTAAQWFRQLDPYVRCEVHHRLRFVGAKDDAPFPTSLFYLGQRAREFIIAFRCLGRVVWEVHHAQRWFIAGELSSALMKYSRSKFVRYRDRISSVVDMRESGGGIYVYLASGWEWSGRTVIHADSSRSAACALANVKRVERGA